MSKRLNYLSFKIRVDEDKYFENIHRPIEIFCRQEYKGYSIRSQICELPYPGRGIDGQSEIYYRILLTALVSSSYKNADGDMESPEHYRFGTIWSRTKDDFKSARFAYESTINDGVKSKTAIDKIIRQKELHSPISVNIKDIRFIEDEYVKQGIAEKRKIILTDLRILPNRTGHPLTGKEIREYPGCTFPFVATHFSPDSEELEDDVTMWFSNLYDTLGFQFDYSGLSKKEFFSLLESIGNMANEFIVKREITKEFLQRLNHLRHNIDLQNPLGAFCYGFVDSLVKYLYEKKGVSLCLLCGDAIHFRENKRYCSLLGEGKDCGKKARNRFFYERHQSKLKRKARKSMAELRSCYKEKGAKKKVAILKNK